MFLRLVLLRLLSLCMDMMCVCNISTGQIIDSRICGSTICKNTFVFTEMHKQNYSGQIIIELINYNLSILKHLLLFLLYL